MQQTQILIVGGSLVGLSSALFLASQGVQAITVERHSGSSPHPRAIGYTARTMELLRAVGLGGVFPETPTNFRLRRVRVFSVAGERLSESNWTPSEEADTTEDPISPVRGVAIAQDRIEPVLRNRALELGADIQQSTELLAFQQGIAEVTAWVRSRETGLESTISAQYMIAADGGDSVIRGALNIGRTGRGHIRYVRSVLFRANLDEYLADGVAQWEIEQPDLKAFLTTYQDGRWVLMFLDDVQRDFAALHASIRKAIGREDIFIEIITTGRWDMSALVADRFSSGRIFLAGDAAHQLPPTRGGYGANTGIHDAHNLAWKLAAVLSGRSTPALLETYDSERRPVAWSRHQQIFARPDYAKDANGWGVNEPIINDEAMEFGQLYRSTAVIGAGPELPYAQKPRQWQGQPGTRAPHFPVVHGGVAMSFLDLLQSGWLVVSVDPSWRTAAHQASTAGAAVNVAIAGEDFTVQTETELPTMFGIAAEGAVLIRPDGVIAWRTSRPADSSSLLRAIGTTASMVGGAHFVGKAK